MNRRDFCRDGLAVATSIACLSRRSWGTTNPACNILLLVAEDVGPHFGCYGDYTVPTPHLDKIGREGMVFECAYSTQATCSPARSSILTGLYPHQSFQLGLAHRGYLMHEQVPILPTALSSAGYRTGIVGKIHVNPPNVFTWNYESRPDMFDVRQYSRELEAFISSGNGGQPFFLMMNYGDTHRPYSDFYKGLPCRPIGLRETGVFPQHGEIDHVYVRNDVAGYYNGVQRFDAGVGFVIEALRKNGLLDSTLIMVLGDHGPGFSRGKTTCYELGLRIPLLIRWPEVCPQNSRSTSLVSLVDILPTCLEAAGSQAPVGISGESLVPLLQDNQSPWRRELCAEYNCHEPEFKPERTIRNDSYKLILNLRTDVPKNGLGVDGCWIEKIIDNPEYNDTQIKRVLKYLANPVSVELYDLKRDPAEFDNLADLPVYSTIRDDLLTKLATWRADTCDPFLDQTNLDVMIAHHDAYWEMVNGLTGAGTTIPPIDMLSYRQVWNPCG